MGLKSVENDAVSKFFRKEIDAGRESYLRKRQLRYRVGGKKRFSIHARSKRAYVWQSGRFRRDVEFWREAIGDQAGVSPVKDGEALRFYLSTEEDFARFGEAIAKQLQGVEFLTTEELEEEVDT